jgi:hypothetical protein
VLEVLATTPRIRSCAMTANAYPNVNACPLVGYHSRMRPLSPGIAVELESELIHRDGATWDRFRIVLLRDSGLALIKLSVNGQSIEDPRDQCWYFAEIAAGTIIRTTIVNMSDRDVEIHGCIYFRRGAETL